MRTLPHPDLRGKRPSSATEQLATRSDASIRDSVRILTEVVTQLSERVEVLEARELLHRSR